MVNQGAVETTVDQGAAAAWSQHIQGAVSEFLKTAVVIDNQPWVRPSKKKSATEAQESGATDSGMGEETDYQATPPTTTAEPEDHLHDIDLRAVSDAFVSQGVACAFVLPDDEDPTASPELKIERAVAAAKISDLVVIDWYLADKSESLTLQILKRISESDSEENGRLRLICVYTGEPLKDSILEDIIKSLKDGGVTVEKSSEINYCATGENTVVAVFNKTETKAKDLPSELIKLFSRFSDGLIPAFSLAAVGAIRKNAHHILTRFGKFLDTAYISNRIITDPPGDVSEMMRDLFVAECDSAIGLEAVADRYLDTEGITKWINIKSSEIQTQTQGETVVDKSVLLQLLNEGIKAAVTMGERTKKIPQKHHLLVSSALAGAKKDHRESEHEFARLAALKREAYGRSKLFSDQGWRPSLTTGTIVMYTPRTDQNQGVAEYLICLTPACDTLRLTGETPFVFLRTKVNEEKFGMVLREKMAMTPLLELTQKGRSLEPSCSHQRTPLITIAYLPIKTQTQPLTLNSRAAMAMNFFGLERFATFEQRRKWHLCYRAGCALA